MSISWAGENIWVGSNAMLITENVSLHLNATLPPIAPNRHICGKTVVWRYIVVDVLLRNLSGEVDVLVRLPQMVRACLAGMSVWDVKTT